MEVNESTSLQVNESTSQQVNEPMGRYFDRNIEDSKTRYFEDAIGAILHF